MADRPVTPSAIIRSYLVINGLYTLSASLIWGVNTLFLLDSGLNIFGVFIANSAFTGSMALFEIPTGVLADTRGRRFSFLLSMAILLLGTAGYVGAAAAGGKLVLFVFMSVILGLGFTFYSGAMEAWLVDSLKAVGYTDQFDQVFARASMVSGGAMIIGTVGGGLLGNADLSFPFVARAILLGVVFVFSFFTMHELGFTPRALKIHDLPIEMRKIFKASVTYGWDEKQIRFLLIVSFIQDAFFVWGFYAWQPYILELLGQNLPWVAGVLAAFISIAMIIGNSIVDWLTKFCGKRTTFLIWAFGIQAVAVIGVGLSGSFWLAIGFFLAAMVTMGVIMPVKQAYIHEVIPSEQRATVVSFNSLFSSGGSMIGQSGLGYLSQIRSIASGYVVGGVSVIFTLPVLYFLRRLNQSGDIIVGKAGVNSTCAAQGIPSVSMVNDLPPTSRTLKAD